MKEINLNKTVYQLTEERPELIEILFELGFRPIKNPITRNTLGRFVTIPKGCKQQGKDLNKVIRILKEKGFEIIK